MTKEREVLKLARQLLWRYRHETPIGHQPHMICQEVDEAFERIDEALAQPEQRSVSEHLEPVECDCNQGQSCHVCDPYFPFDSAPQTTRLTQKTTTNDVAIGVDVTEDGTHVTAMRMRPDGINIVIYSQFHPLAQPEQEPVAWQDRADEWSDEISAHHPMKTKAYKQWDTAMAMVGARHSKSALVELVCWLLQKSTPTQRKPLTDGSLIDEGTKKSEHEPVAYFNPQVKGGFYWAKPTKITAPVTVSVEPMPLYTTPPTQQSCSQRTWVNATTWRGLTEQEQGAIMEDLNAHGTNLYPFAQAVEAKLKEKNNGT